MSRVAAILSIVLVLGVVGVVPADEHEQADYEQTAQMSAEGDAEPPVEGEEPSDPPAPPPPPEMELTAAPTYAPVLMEYAGPNNGCVVLSEDVVEIFRYKKPNRVMWVVTNPGRYWEIRWDNSGNSGKPVVGANYLGSVDIGCNDPAGKSGQGSNVPQLARWPYKIVVYACQDGAKVGQPLCTKDPRIDWGD